MSPKGQKKTCNLSALLGEASQPAESSAGVALLKDFSRPSEGLSFPARSEILSPDLRVFLSALCFVWPKKNCLFHGLAALRQMWGSTRDKQNRGMVWVVRGMLGLSLQRSSGCAGR